ncbi:MAG: beta-lactamase family protein [Deltaproteobacteria bacterium]|nr:beta-lactamase family protein [Deltaproteobacteria bacterium]
MKLSDQKLIGNALNDSCKTFVFSGYQLATEFKGAEVCWHGGQTSYWPEATSIEDNSYFDLGSLTKVILTTSVIARLVDQNKLDVSLRVREFIPEYKKSRFGEITLKKLLTHSSGLIGWFPFYLEKNTNVLELFLKNENKFLLDEVPTKTVYSDLGFLLLGEVLKKGFGDLQTLFKREVLSPLNLVGIELGPLSFQKTVATEYCLERKRLIQGEVFDHNTVHFGGVCAHAGLFSSAKNLLPWAREWLKAVQGRSGWLSRKTAVEFVMAGQGGAESTWALGWDTKSKVFSSAGDLLSMESFGHLGFPGTSVWIDPRKSGIIVLLTNRIHPSRLDERIKRFRPFIHNLVAKSWESHGS